MPWSEHLAQVVEHYGTGAATKTIVDLIEEGIHAQRAVDEQERLEERGTLDKLNPFISDAGKECERQVYLSLRNVEPSDPIDTNSLINFGVGSAVEEWFANIMEMQGAEILREQRVEIPVDGTKVTGRADFLISWPSARLLIEMKSTSSRAMNFMLKRNQGGYDTHRRQLLLYVHASKLGLLPHAFDSGVLVYVVKDATKGEPVVHAFEVSYDEEIARSELNWLATLAEIARAGDEPAIPQGYTRSKFPCSYCSYKGHCFG